MITITTIEGRYTPRAICDACGEPVTEPKNAVVVWAMGAGTEHRTPYVAHGGRCHDAVDKRIKATGGCPGWNSYDKWMADLLWNSGLRANALQAAVDDSDRWHEVGL